MVKVNIIKDKNIEECKTVWKRTKENGLGLYGNETTLKKFIDSIDNNIIIVVAKDKEKIIGSVIARYNGYDTGIYHLNVDKEYRKQGIGEKLLKTILKECKKRKWKDLILTVEKENKIAVKLYKKVGFVKHSKHYEIMTKNDCEDWEKGYEGRI